MAVDLLKSRSSNSNQPHLLSDERDPAQTIKRGARADILSEDAQEAESRSRIEPVGRRDVQKIYERRWAMTLLEQALDRLRDEMAAAGKAGLFERLKAYVAGERGVWCGQVCAQLGISEGANRSAVHRLRQRHRELVREEIVRPVADPLRSMARSLTRWHCDTQELHRGMKAAREPGRPRVAMSPLYTPAPLSSGRSCFRQRRRDCRIQSR